MKSMSQIAFEVAESGLRSAVRVSLRRRTIPASQRTRSALWDEVECRYNDQADGLLGRTKRQPH